MPKSMMILIFLWVLFLVPIATVAAAPCTCKKGTECPEQVPTHDPDTGFCYLVCDKCVNLNKCDTVKPKAEYPKIREVTKPPFPEEMPSLTGDTWILIAVKTPCVRPKDPKYIIYSEGDAFDDFEFENF